MSVHFASVAEFFALPLQATVAAVEYAFGAGS